MIHRRALLAASVAAAPLLMAISPERQRLLLLSGSKRNIPAGVTLDLSFNGPTLDPRLTFTRGSTATYFDATGTMQTAAMNLLVGSQGMSAQLNKSDTVIADNNTTAPDGTLSASLATEGVAGSAIISNVNIVSVAGGVAVTASVFLKRGNTDFVRTILTDAGLANGINLWISLATGSTSFTMRGTATNGSVSRIALPGGWFRVISTCTLPGTSTSATLSLCSASADGANTRVNNATYYLWGLQIELAASAGPYTPTTTVVNGAPRFDYNPVTLTPNGLLIEEARTNLVLNSGDLTVGATWPASAVVVTTGTDMAPTGSPMSKLTENGAASPHFVPQSGIPVTAGPLYTLSCFAQADTRRYLQLGIDDPNNGGFATFDLLAGTVSQALAARGAGAILGAATITSIGNNVWRCSISVAIPSTSARVVIIMANSAAPGFAPSYTGNPSQFLSVWGAQFEQGAFPTSYIPTTGAAVTRNVETCTTPTAPWFSPGASTLMGEFLVVTGVPNPTGRVREVCGLSDGTASNRMALRAMNQGATTSVFFSSVSGVNAVSPAVGNVVAGSVMKLAAAWDGVTERGSMNGGAIISSASGMATGINVLTLTDNVPNQNGSLNGYLRRVRYWPRVLSNAELQSVTT